MVELMLQRWKEGIGETCNSKPEIQVFLVNCRLATSLEDIGRRPWAKILLLIRYLLQARKMLREHPIDAIYYCPGRATLNNALRDLFVLSLLRLPLGQKNPNLKSKIQNPKLVLHWHAVGLESGIATWTTHPWLSGVHAFVSARVHSWLKPHLQSARHITLSRWHAGVLRKTLGVEATVVPNGIPDPVGEKQQWRKQKVKTILEDSENQQSPRRILFMSMLTRAKGFHDTLTAHKELLRSWLAGMEAQPWRLDVAGSFVDDDGRRAWERAQADPVLQEAEKRTGQALLIHHGFVDGAAKTTLFQQADVFCFPTRYKSESFGLVALEAMAWGVPVVATDWQALPEILGPEYPFLLSINDETLEASDQKLASIIISASASTIGPQLRQRYLEDYCIDSFQLAITSALREIQASA